MSGDGVSSEEFGRFASNTEKLLARLVDQYEELKEYMIHNDYRHTETDKEISEINKKIKTLTENHKIIIEILDERKPIWQVIKNMGLFGKFVGGAFLLAVAAAAGKATYNYCFEPVAEVKTVTASVNHD